MKITWETRSAALTQSFRSGEKQPFANGGAAYNFHAASVLRDNFEFELDGSFSNGLHRQPWMIALRQYSTRKKSFIRIRDPILFSLGRPKHYPIEVLMIHHLNGCAQRITTKQQWLYKRLVSRLPSVDCVVTVAEYWKNQLELLGAHNVTVIHNAIDADEVAISQDEVDHFLDKFFLPADRPIVYIGNAKIEKGVVEVYHALKDKPFTLVMTGPNVGAIDIPVHHLFLSEREYLTLLKASSVVVTMSRMIEGWNRTAHAAMLCGTPVIGSGTGGMGELLKGGMQFIVSGPSEVADIIEQVIAMRDEIGVAGRRFVENFSGDYFRDSWTSLVHKLSGCET